MYHEVFTGRSEILKDTLDVLTGWLRGDRFFFYFEIFPWCVFCAFAYALYPLLIVTCCLGEFLTDSTKSYSYVPGCLLVL